jgi:hypothetical protein
MNLTKREIACLDRFCYALDYFLHGKDRVFQECRGYYQDLGTLTNFAPWEAKAQWEKRDRLPRRESLSPAISRRPEPQDQREWRSTSLNVLKTNDPSNHS